MGKSSFTETNELLPEFQKFLQDKKLAPEKNVFFFALWVSKFFNYARKKQISTESYQEKERPKVRWMPCLALEKPVPPTAEKTSRHD